MDARDFQSLATILAPPRGFLSAREWSHHWGVTISRAYGKINALMVSGAMERRITRVTTVGGRRDYPSPRYRMKSR